MIMNNKSMNKMKYCLWAMIGLVLSLSACIQEDMSQCGSEVQICFSYNDDVGSRSIDSGELKKAMLYAFDSDNQLTYVQEILDPELDVFYTIILDPDTYSFVVWFNPVAPYAITPMEIGTTLKSEGQLSLEIPSTRRVQGSAVEFLPLLYGQKEEAIQKNEDNVVTIPVSENTNRINITVRGLIPTTHTYHVSIEDANGVYTFDNDFDDSCPTFSYVAETQYATDSDILKASLTVLRLAEDRPTPTLTIQDMDTGEILYPFCDETPDNLIELLQKLYPHNDFSKNHLYNIDIKFDETAVWINDWQVVSPDIILTPWKVK